MVWNVGNMSCHERDGLGDKSVQGKTNQREDRKAMNQKIGGVKETSTTSTSPSKYVMRMNNQENKTMRKKNCNITPFVLRGLRNQISSSAHSSVVRRHVELSDTWFFN